MQERKSPRDEHIVSPDLVKTEPVIMKKKLSSAKQRPDPGASKPSVQSIPEQSRNVEKPVRMSESLNPATGSSKASVLSEKVPKDGMVLNEKLISENQNDGQLSQVPITPKKDSGEPNVIPSTEGCSSTLVVKRSLDTEVQLSEFSKVSIITKGDPDDLEHGHGPDTGRNEKSLALFHSPVPTSSSDQDNMSYSAMSEKTVYKLQPRRNPDCAVQVQQMEQDNSASRGREKELDDGYNWRKYGQKFVKGNAFVKSYYKCTFSDCRAKKQVERCHDGRLTDIKYIGGHVHPKPNSSQVPAVVQPIQVFQTELATVTKEEPAAAEKEKMAQPIEAAQTPKESAGLENNDNISPLPPVLVDDNSCPNPKRQKIENTGAEESQVRKSYCESRQVVQMMSAVDIVHDGYRWRKYGQKLVKGNPNPRSYYRCSNAGCTVKKHVERASHDPKLVVTTYEGNHDHDMPNPRIITHTVTEAEGGSVNNGATMNGESKSELGNPNRAAGDLMVHLRLQNNSGN